MIKVEEPSKVKESEDKYKEELRRRYDLGRNGSRGFFTDMDLKKDRKSYKFLITNVIPKDIKEDK